MGITGSKSASQKIAEYDNQVTNDIIMQDTREVSYAWGKEIQILNEML